MANAAGVLAGQLEGYLYSRTYHLIIPWRSRDDLRVRLDEIATEAAEASFPHFCRLVWLFDAFQFQGSTTYLLTDHSAGNMCKRLYNMFIATVPLDLKLANIREMETEIEQRGKLVTKKLRDLPSGALTDEQIRDGLAEEKKVYVEWFKNSVPSVSIAADALRAYTELLNHELTLLYRLWFNRRPPFPEAYAFERAMGNWPDVLTRQSVTTLGVAGYQSNLLRPLGAARTAERSAPKLKGERHTVPAEKTEPEPQSGEDRDTGQATPKSYLQ